MSNAIPSTTPDAIPSTTTSRKRRPGFRSVSEIPKLPQGDHADRETRGLSMRVTAGGSRVFRWRLRGEGRTVTLAPWCLEPMPGRLTLRDAREWLDRLTNGRRSELGCGSES